MESANEFPPTKVANACNFHAGCHPFFPPFVCHDSPPRAIVGDGPPAGDRPKTQVFLGAAAQDARWWARSGGVRHPHVSNNAGQAVEALISEMRVSRDLVSPPSSMVARFPDPERCWIRIGNLPGVCSKMVSWPGFALEPSGARGTMDGCFLCCHCQSRASQCQPVIHQPRMSSECNCRT